jgi:succinate dehydrogenase / fumarate reductase flavoprotein subunit
MRRPLRIEPMPDGEACRDDASCCYVAAWQFRGDDREPELHKEPLAFENVELSERSYK